MLFHRTNGTKWPDDEPIFQQATAKICSISPNINGKCIWKSKQHILVLQLCRSVMNNLTEINECLKCYTEHLLNPEYSCQLVCQCPAWSYSQSTSVWTHQADGYFKMLLAFCCVCWLYIGGVTVSLVVRREAVFSASRA